MKKTKFFPPMKLHRSGERQRTSKQITTVSDQIVVRVMEEKREIPGLDWGVAGKRRGQSVYNKLTFQQRHKGL